MICQTPNRNKKPRKINFMPTYDYICENCNHKFEEFQSITAKNLRKCPECGKMQLQRAIGTGAGIIFKGSGFYETDYRSDGYKQDAKKATSETSSKTDKKADTKTKSADTKKPEKKKAAEK